MWVSTISHCFLSLQRKQELLVEDIQSQARTKIALQAKLAYHLFMWVLGL